MHATTQKVIVYLLQSKYEVNNYEVQYIQCTHYIAHDVEFFHQVWKGNCQVHVVTDLNERIGFSSLNNR